MEMGKWKWVNGKGVEDIRDLFEIEVIHSYF